MRQVYLDKCVCGSVKITRYACVSRCGKHDCKGAWLQGCMGVRFDILCAVMYEEYVQVLSCAMNK